MCVQREAALPLVLDGEWNVLASFSTVKTSTKVDLYYSSLTCKIISGAPDFTKISLSKNFAEHQEYMCLLLIVATHRFCSWLNTSF